MKLVDAATWAEEHFHPKSKPDMRTIRGWVKNGYLPGRLMGPRLVYIDVDAWQKQQTGNELADRVLGKVR